MISISVWLHMKWQLLNWAWNLLQKHTLNCGGNDNNIQSVSLPSHSTCDLQQNTLLFGPQVPLCQMRGLNGITLILYSSHCILDYSNMSLSVHIPTGHDWDNGRWQGTHSYQWNALQLWASQTWTGSGSDGRQTESLGCGSPTTTKLVPLTGLWICTRRHTL